MRLLCVCVCVCVRVVRHALAHCRPLTNSPAATNILYSDSHKLRSGRDVTARIGSLQALLGLGEGGGGVYLAPGGAEAAAVHMEA